jgi:hypothetical protein
MSSVSSSLLAALTATAAPRRTGRPAERAMPGQSDAARRQVCLQQCPCCMIKRLRGARQLSKARSSRSTLHCTYLPSGRPGQAFESCTQHQTSKRCCQIAVWPLTKLRLASLATSVWKQQGQGRSSCLGCERAVSTAQNVLKYARSSSPGHQASVGGACKQGHVCESGCLSALRRTTSLS